MFDPFLDKHVVSLGRFQLVMYDGWYGHMEDHHKREDYSLNIGVGHVVEDGTTVGTFAFCPHCGILHMHPDDRHCAAIGTPIDGTPEKSDGGQLPAQASPVKTPHDLPHAALVDIVATVQGRLYLDLDDAGCEFWNPGKEWSGADVCQDIQEILNRYGLVPGEEQAYEDAVSTGGEDIGQLVEFAEANGLEPQDLDDIVHNCAAATASAINNSGWRGQIEFLVDQLGQNDLQCQLSARVAASESHDSH